MSLYLLRFCSRLRFYCTMSGNSVKNGKESAKYPMLHPSGANTVSRASDPVIKDIIIFRYENPRLFKYLHFFAITQFGFWMWIAYSSLSLIYIPVNKSSPSESSKPNDELPFWRTINLGENKYKYGLFIGSILMGYGILFSSWGYALRSIRYLVLRKDRKTVSIVTYGGPLGRNRIMDVPLDCISAAGSRFSGGSQMPIRVKNKYLFYIMELKGEFPHPALFDRTVGVKRNF